MSKLVEGDLRAPGLLLARCRDAAAGISSIHCAADYRLYCTATRSELYETNVEGTRNILLQATARGRSAPKVVYTSSVGALGLRPDGAPANESKPVTRRSR